MKNSYGPNFLKELGHMANDYFFSLLLHNCKRSSSSRVVLKKVE